MSATNLLQLIGSLALLLGVSYLAKLVRRYNRLKRMAADDRDRRQTDWEKARGQE